MRRRKNFGHKSLQREIKFISAIFIIFGFIVFAIAAGIGGAGFSFDLRNKAAGKTHYVNDGKELEDAIAKSADSDAIFLKVGSYTTTNPNGFLIKDKNIRIVGAGEDFVDVSGNNNSYVFTVQNATVGFESFKIRGATKDGVLIKNSNTKEVSFKDIELTSNSGSAINTDTKTIILNSLLNQNGTGVVSSNGELTVRNSVIQNSAQHGIEIKNSSTAAATLENIIISKNKVTGILLSGGSNHTLKNITAGDNGIGIKETSDTKSLITNSIILNSENEGILLAGTSTAVNYSNSYNNKVGDFKPDTLKTSTGNLSLAPQTVSNVDYHLAVNSELKDKGNPAEKDRDGSIIDMGAYGGLASIDDANSAPQITSTPINFVTAGQQYIYEVIATDPDGDVLDYIVLNSNIPSWIKQEGNKFSGIPRESDVGFVGISLVVTDRQGHNIVQPISINVLSANRPVAPTAVPTSSPQPTNAPIATPTTAPVQTQAPVITIISPTKDTKLEENTAEIKWDIKNRENIEKIVLKYSSDKENFETIATLSPERNSFPWDLTNITNSSYIIKIEVFEKGSDKPIAQQSEQFEVSKKAADDTKQNIVITKISPEDNDIVDNKRQTILVEFTPKVDIDKSKSFIKVNGTNVDFQTTQGTIYHTPTKDLTGSRVQVEVKIVSNEGSEASRKWIFKLPNVTNPEDTTPDAQAQDKINILGLKLPKPIGLIILAAVIFGLLILMLYFIVKLVRTIRDERQGNLEAEFTEYYDTNPQTSDQTTYDATSQTYQSVAPDDHTYLVENPEATQHVTENSTTYSQPQTQDFVEYQTAAQPNSENISTVEETTTYTPQTEESNQATEYSNDQTTDFSQASTTTSQSTNPDLNTTTNTQSLDADPIAVESNVSQQGIAQTDYTQQTNTQTTTTSTTTEPEDPYVEELKRKYGITNTDINEYKETDVTTAQSIDSDNTDQNSLPDPSQASTPPKKDNL